MEKLILGLLMLDKLTVYEIRGIVDENFKSMCSDSLGGIQAALKRLLATGKVTFSEQVENGVNKKRYAITEAGRAEFMAWVNTPAAISHPRNIELGKLLFMGLAPHGNRKSLIDEAIALLRRDMAYLMKIYDGVAQMDMGKKLDSIIQQLEGDRAYYDGIVRAAGSDDFRQNMLDIAYYEQKALQYGIDATQFQIDWLTKLGEEITEGHERGQHG